MITTARLSLALYRFELVAVVVGSILLASAILYMTAQVNAVAPTTDCLRGFLLGGGTTPAGCPDVQAFFAAASGAGTVMALMAVLPLGVGSLVGSVIVSREIETRTAGYGWSLSSSRQRWLLDRVVPVGLVLLVAVAIPSLAAVALEQARMPWVSAQDSFADFELRGPIVLARVMAAFGVGILIGSIVGRQLPALVLTLVTCVAIGTYITGMAPFGVAGVPVEANAVSATQPLSVGVAYRDESGQLRTFADAAQTAPAGLSGDDLRSWVYDHYERVELVVPGTELATVQLRESAILVAIAVAASAAAAQILRRRRPY